MENIHVDTGALSVKILEGKMSPGKTIHTQLGLKQRHEATEAMRHCQVVV